MLFTADHDEPRRILQKLIAAEINPFVDAVEHGLSRRHLGLAHRGRGLHIDNDRMLKID